jgi:hypothetical protein
MYGLRDILFGNSRDFVDFIQTIEAAATLVRPIKPDQLHSRRHHPISVAIKTRVDQHITRSGLYAAVVSRFLETASQHNACIGVQVPMPGQVEAAGQGFYSWRDMPKPRIVDREPHVNV